MSWRVTIHQFIVVPIARAMRLRIRTYPSRSWQIVEMLSSNSWDVEGTAETQMSLCIRTGWSRSRSRSCAQADPGPGRTTNVGSADVILWGTRWWYNRVIDETAIYILSLVKWTRSNFRTCVPSKHTTSQQRCYNVAATSWRYNDVVATLCVVGKLT